MKRHTVLVFVLLLSLVFTGTAASRPKPKICATISSGQIVYPEGHYWAGTRVKNGFDDYGFSYHLQYFTGPFVNSNLGFWGFPPYKGDYAAYIAANPDAAALGDPADPNSYWALKDLTLVITWNEAYRSRTDCDGDGWFDRHAGAETYIGTGAWYTNQVRGTFAGQAYNTYSMVAAVPADATLVDGYWYTAAGEEFGYAVDDAAIGMAGVYDWMEGVGVLYEGVGYQQQRARHIGRPDRPGMGGWKNAIAAQAGRSLISP